MSPKHLVATLLAVVGLGHAAPALAEARTICAYDPAGKSGDFYRFIEAWALDASSWGVDLELKAYTDEATAAKDYEAGHCDGVVATGVRLQRFNRFPSTIEAMGAVPTYDILGQMVRTLATYESAAAKLTSGDHQTIGFLSAGAVYLFVRDRSLDSVPELAGKRIATMDYDVAAPTMVERVGAIMVPADLGSIGPKFNNADVDVAYMSAPGYQPFELWRGLGTNGGILRRPIAQATLQVMVRTSRFPADFPGKSRTWFSTHFQESIDQAKRADATIPAQYWVDIPAAEAAKWDKLFQEVRVDLRDRAGAYDGTMLSALKKLRCSADATRAECAEAKE